LAREVCEGSAARSGHFPPEKESLVLNGLEAGWVPDDDDNGDDNSEQCKELQY